MASRLRGLNWVGSLLLVGLFGCGKSSPTEPETGYFIIPSDGVIENVSGAATLIAVQSLIDGSPATFAPLTGAPRSSDRVTGALLSPSVVKGSHTLEIRVLDQVSSPNVYRVHDVRVEIRNIGGTVTFGRAVLPEATQSLSTGQSIVYQFSF